MKQAMILATATVVLHAIMACAATTPVARPLPLRYQHAQRTHAPMYLRQHRAGNSTLKVRPHQSQPVFHMFSSPTMNLGFFTGSALSAGGESFGAPAVGDFDGNGNQDVAIMVSADYGVTFSIAMMPGNGDGTFGTPVLTSCAFGYGDLMYTADLNGDAKDDVILVHSGNLTGSLDVYLSTGGGNFASPVTYSESAANPAAVAVVDVNGDGKIDIVIADGLAAADGSNPIPSVSTFLGNGDGTFNSPTQVTYPGPIASGVFADVNADGKLDLVSNSQVILASAGGGYQPPTSLIPPSGQTTCAAVDGVVAVGDLNGDTYPDIATADCQNDTVSVYLNNGDGTFQAGTSYWAGYYPQGLAMADVSGDTRKDIVVTNADSADAAVLLGNGDGTFQTPAVGFSVGGFPWEKPVLADFNHDSKLDLLAANNVPDISFALTYLQGFGDGTFAAARDYYSPQPAAGGYAYGVGVASADFNADGKPDFALGNWGSSDVGITVFLGNSTGLQPGVTYGSGGNLNFVASGDFNGDTKPDLVASDDAAGNVDLFLGNGDGTFQSPTVYSAGSGPAQGLAVGDFNGDSRPDVAVVTAPNNVIVLINNGSGGFNSPVSYSITSLGMEIAAADFNNDGILDLVIPQSEANSVSVLLGNGDGTFTARPDFDLGSSFPVAVAVGDWNGDGKNDLAVTIDDYNTGMGIAVALGNGDGTFQTATLYPTTTNTGTGDPYPSEIRAGDVNQDGFLDLVYVNSEFGTTGILYGTGSGTFGSPNEFPAGGYPYGLVMADANGDGGVDAIVGGDSFSGVTVLLNSSGSTASLASSLNPAVSGTSVTFTATVTAGARGVTVVPGGSVTFYDGATSLGSGTLSGGQVTFTTSSLSVGSHSITASYSGDSSFFQNTSAPLTQVINIAGSAPSYQVSANPTSATIQRGQSANFTVTVNPINGYRGTVTLSCGSLPLGVSCQFNPASVTPSTGPAQSVLTLTTASITAVNRSHAQRLLPLWSTGLFGFILIEGISRRRRIAAAVFAIALFALLTLTGCGAGASSSASAAKTVQTVHVIATSASGGTTSQQVNITITIVN